MWGGNVASRERGNGCAFLTGAVGNGRPRVRDEILYFGWKEHNGNFIMARTQSDLPALRKGGMSRRSWVQTVQYVQRVLCRKTVLRKALHNVYGTLQGIRGVR